MKSTLTTHLIFLLCIAFVVSCGKEATISKQHITDVIRTLSSDNMMGRDAMGDEIQNAADFISGEFQKIGLQALPGQSDFRQTFSIYSMHPSVAKLVINGQELPAEKSFSLMNEEEISWTTGKASILSINEDDSFRDKFKEYTTDDKSSLIKIDESHMMYFHRYRTYYSRSNRSFELGVKPNDVFILYNSKVRSYDINIKNKVKEIELFNVGGMIEGERKDEIVLFSAHYDHIGVVTPVNGDSIGNGANDNASGVAAIVELARYYSKIPKPTRSIYFVAFTAEEAGGYGSQFFSKVVEPEQIKAMLNIEMIGKPAVERPNTAWITGFEKSDLGEILQNSLSDSSFTFYADPYPNQNLFYRSDNATLARLGVPAHTISTTPIDVDQDYHKVTDEFHTLSMGHIVNTVRAIAQASKVIISGQETPTRISANSLN